MLSVNWSWVTTEDAVNERREHARELVGQQLSSVTYVTMDYRRLDEDHTTQGPRWIRDDAELAAPTWHEETFDAVDYGVELATVSGQVFTVSWDSPGWHEGIWIRKVSALGSACTEDAAVALWDVSRTSRWTDLVDGVITDLMLHYRPVAGDGYWCSRIDLRIGDRSAHMLLGEASGGQRLVPSGDNVAVVFSPKQLPEWAQ
jgi:hypothetical protein